MAALCNLFSEPTFAMNSEGGELECLFWLEVISNWDLPRLGTTPSRRSACRPSYPLFYGLRYLHFITYQALNESDQATMPKTPLAIVHKSAHTVPAAWLGTRPSRCPLATAHPPFPACIGSSTEEQISLNICTA